MNPGQLWSSLVWWGEGAGAEERAGSEDGAKKTRRGKYSKDIVVSDRGKNSNTTYYGHTTNPRYKLKTHTSNI